MGKVVDITEKLAFGEKPALLIKGRRFEVNDDAKTVLEIMGDFDSENGKGEKETIMTALGRLFSEDDREVLLAKLKFKDLMTVVENAMALVSGANDDEGKVEGEAETQTTTW